MFLIKNTKMKYIFHNVFYYSSKLHFFLQCRSKFTKFNIEKIEEQIIDFIALRHLT